MKTTVEMIDRSTYVAMDRLGNRTAMDIRTDDAEKKASSPMELTLSALGGCVSADIATVLEKRKKHIDALSIELEGIRCEAHPRGFNNIHFLCKMTSPDVDEEELRKVTEMALEKYCSVAASLTAKIAFSIALIRPQV